MSNYEVLVKNGPSEAALAHAMDRHTPVVFRVEEGVLEVRLDALEGLRDDAGLAIRGSIVSGPYQGHSSVGLTTGRGVGDASSSRAFPNARGTSPGGRMCRCTADAPTKAPGREQGTTARRARQRQGRGGEVRDGSLSGVARDIP